MKVVTIMVFVLTCVSVSQGTIWMEASDTVVEPGEIITVSVFADGYDSYGGYLWIHTEEGQPDLGDCSVGHWTGQSVILPAAGPDAMSFSMEPDGFPCYFYFQSLSFNPVTPVVPGEHHRVEYEGLESGPGTYAMISLLDFDAVTVMQTIVLDQTIPEPATVLLLGGGMALAVRRRRGVVRSSV